MIIKRTVEDRAETEKEVDKVIAEFDSWFQEKGNDPLVRGEAAIIKTFLYYALFERKEDGS